ncbi:MAG: RHS repeat protein [Planctomycetes bacterium]|nr:RHS repeat protein [Planctomycetota bacterium]
MFRKRPNRIISVIVMAAFLFSQFAGIAFAEAPCWNDGTINQNNGGAQSDNPEDFNEDQAQEDGEPVNLLTGNFSYEVSDLAIPSRAIHFEFARFYNSLDDYDGPLGRGWNHNYNISLTKTSDGVDTYVSKKNSDGDKEIFTYLGNGQYQSPAGNYDTLVEEADKFVLTTKHGIRYEFTLAGWLTSIADRNGNQMMFVYDPGGKLVTIKDTAGREIVLTYNASNKISALSDFTGRTTNYGYDANNNLITVTRPPTPDYPEGTTTTYVYDSANRLTTVLDGYDQEYLFNHYADDGKVDWQKYKGGYFDFQYDTTNLITTVTDREGNVTTWRLNEDGTAASKTIDSFTTTYAYNANQEITKITYPRGNSIEYTYDAHGNVIQITKKPIPGSTESDIVTILTYESNFSFVKTVTDPRGNITTYTYDYEFPVLDPNYGENGNLVQITYPQVNGQAPEIYFTYNNFGQIETVTNPLGSITKYEYYANTGYLKRAILAYGVLDYVTEIGYDSAGNIANIKDARGNITNFEFNSHNLLTKVTSPGPFNYVTTYAYDKNDQMIEVNRQTDDVSNPWQTTVYTYISLDKVKTITDDLENRVTLDYDKNENRTSLIDAEGNAATYTYNSRDLLENVVDALGNAVEYSYDENGNLKTIEDAKGNVTSYEYDDFDRVKTVVYPDTSKKYFTYDTASNLKTRKDPKGQMVTYDYDALNQLDFKTYSSDGSTVDYVYDMGSRLIDVVNSTGTIHNDYDAVNRLTQVIYPDTKSVSYEYDANSNRTKLTYPDLTHITYEYDELNRLTDIKDQAAQVIANYSYDTLSRRAQLNLANNTRTTYTYDPIDRLSQIKNQQINPQTTLSQYDYAYDNAGNRKTMTTMEDTHQYTYDDLYQMTNADYPEGFSFADTAFAYDAAGNRISTINGGITNYTTNNLNQYTRVGNVDYIYDANGNLTLDGMNTYAYDEENRLTTVITPTTSSTYSYDVFGRRIEKDVDGTVTKFIYDGDQVIGEYDENDVLEAKYVYGPGIDEPILLDKGSEVYYYHFDGLGSVTGLTDTDGNLVETYDYDVYGQPTQLSSLGNRLYFTGREYDPETGLYYYRRRYYDPKIGRFLSRDPLGYVDSPNPYVYALNNPINYIDPYGLWTLQLGFSLNPGLRWGYTVGGGIVISYSRDAGFVLGGYTVFGGGSLLGGSVSGTLDLSISGNESACQLKGQATTLGGSGQFGISGSFGGEINLPHDPNARASYTGSIGIGAGTPEGHMFITRTDIYPWITWR